MPDYLIPRMRTISKLPEIGKEIKDYCMYAPSTSALVYIEKEGEGCQYNARNHVTTSSDYCPLSLLLSECVQ